MELNKNEDIKLFLKLRSLIYIYFEFQNISKVTIGSNSRESNLLDNFTQFCLSDIESIYRKNKKSLTKPKIVDVLKDHYYDSDLCLEDWDGVDVAAMDVAEEFYYYFLERYLICQ